MAERDNLMLFSEVGRIALEDNDDQVKISAIDLLFEAADTRLLPRFLYLLSESGNNEIRAAAAGALGSFCVFG